MFPVLVILGPTAVGKSEMAIHLAENLDGEIVSADSRMFYRRMDIGTAKPSKSERNRVPHHLIDVTEPDSPWSLATFQENAHQALDEIHKRGHIPLLVGGTGQYLRAVILEWRLPKVEPDYRLRKVLETWAVEIGKNELHHRLSLIDPVAAAGIDPRNTRRTIRALEVIFKTGKPFSSQRDSASSRYKNLQIGLTMPRELLYRRIDQRVDLMLELGLVDEVRTLLDSGLSPDLPAFSAIGYREIISYLQGEYNLEDAIRMIKRDTRILVRRQANWFKSNDPEINWFDLTVSTASDIQEFVRSWIEHERKVFI